MADLVIQKAQGNFHSVGIFMNVRNVYGSFLNIISQVDELVFITSAFVVDPDVDSGCLSLPLKVLQNKIQGSRHTIQVACE